MDQISASRRKLHYTMVCQKLFIISSKVYSSICLIIETTNTTLHKETGSKSSSIKVLSCCVFCIYHVS